jgi:hypothetical protein
MLIIALVLAVVGLAALVTAVVTGNALIAWVCIAASVIGVVLLIVDAVRERSRAAGGGPAAVTGTAAHDTATNDDFDADYPDETDSAENFEADDTAGESDPDADTRAVPFDERHEDHNIEVGADHPEEPTTR